VTGVFTTTCIALALMTACTAPSGEPSSIGTAPRSGGTLRVAAPPEELMTSGLDPQGQTLMADSELFRCCLLRTLYSYPGLPTEDGGAELRPDLAASMPTVSRDGLRWTIRLRAGLRYAPPFEGIEITAADFIRALERTARVHSDVNYGYDYAVIEGFDDFGAGATESIAGLEAVDDRTLRVRLVRPSGDLAARLSSPHAAPIPPVGSGARFGAADGLDESYGPFLVSSGPYMYAGSEEVDFSVPPAARRPAEGFGLPASVRLVRNPSWDRATDPLRKAYADRIEINPTSERNALRRLRTGGADVWLLEAAPKEVERYENDPQLADRVHAHDSNGAIYLSFNLALAPLDDIHVRRAINLILDKASIVKEARRDTTSVGGTSGTPAGHILPDSLSNNLLVDYEPYRSTNDRGDVAAARREMASSRYDDDGDGRCDDPACEDLRLPATGAFTLMARVVTRDLHRIGINTSIEEVDVGTYFGEMAGPDERTHLFLNGWFAGYLNASTFFVPLFYGPSIGVGSALNHSLIGASRAQLRGWGYRDISVPTLDDVIEECLALVGGSQVPCWAEADQLLTEDVVPFAPLIATRITHVVSDRVSDYRFAQSSFMPALDRIALD
jgi:peptide/nickel transport system substrate-binding protein